MRYRPAKKNRGDIVAMAMMAEKPDTIDSGIAGGIEDCA